MMRSLPARLWLAVLQAAGLKEGALSTKTRSRGHWPIPVSQPTWSRRLQCVHGMQRCVICRIARGAEHQIPGECLPHTQGPVHVSVTCAGPQLPQRRRVVAVAADAGDRLAHAHIQAY